MEAAQQVGVPGRWVCPVSGCAGTPLHPGRPAGVYACQVGVPARWVCPMGGCAVCGAPPAHGCVGWGATWHVGVPGRWVCRHSTPSRTPSRWVCLSGGCAHQVGVWRGSLALCLLAIRHLLWAWMLLPQASLRPLLGAAPGRGVACGQPRASLSPPSLQTAACPTPASLEPSAAASPTAPGPAALARWASWATAPTARTWTRWVPLPRLRGGLQRPGPRLTSTLLVPQCAVVTDVCFATSRAHRCVNTNPGYHCLPCPPRYKGNQPFGVGLEAARTEKQVSRREDRRSMRCVEGPLALWGAGPRGAECLHSVPRPG